VSDPGFDTSEQQFLRGYQVTDANGVAQFTTIYPGWYSGRTIHIHFKIRTDPDSDEGYEFTSQLFFDGALSDQVHTQEPYASKGQRDTLNNTDNIYNDLLLLAANQSNEGYAATFDIGLDLSDSSVGQPDGGGGPGGGGPPPGG
jgi:protocatechuate 3,4-dioxygenase beta subunit